MEKLLTTGPFVAKLSFRYLKDTYETLSKSENPIDRFQAEQVLELFKEYPVLYDGIATCEDFEEHKDVVGKLMSYLFPPALRNNEIKAASDPLSNFVFYKSSRLEQILNNSNNQGSDVLKKVFKDHIQGYDLIPYAIILNSYYQYDIDFDRPKNLKVKDEHGREKNYRLIFNADFIKIYPNECAVEITQEVVDELLANADDKDVWEHYFPKGSWTMEGFGIINMIDTTLDDNIDGFKTHMIRPNSESYKFLEFQICNWEATS